MSRKNQRARRRTDPVDRYNNNLIAQVRDLPAMNMPTNPAIARQYEQLKKADYVLRLKRYGFNVQ
ncbi:hypothetical protein PP993_gp62 [Gordonia phage Mayweather]|uniref:Uncharacterized protein n=1 Tax=Gordonia phage Mayweather TaxID=2590931 RepID=A0A516KU64_9CAUD|nr:hypothetical protein PP993_gp62 [Gordonia phage Mayweather]QDP45223.1 hypothetical protein SEA_MAYWEATHER_62 [Gordonia phage Mayweather]